MPTTHHDADVQSDLSIFALSNPDNDPLPRLCRALCLIHEDGRYEDIDPVTTNTIEDGWLPTIERKEAA